MAKIENGWNKLACGGSVKVEDGKPVALSDGGAPNAHDCDEAAEVADSETVRRAAEELLGVWIDVDGEWAATNEGIPFEAVAACSLSAEQPTHRLTFTQDWPGGPEAHAAWIAAHPHGSPRSLVTTWIVRLHEADAELGVGDVDPDATEGVAYDHDEWEAEEHADWEVRDGGWYCLGQTSPGGANGTVEVERLAPIDDEPVTPEDAAAIAEVREDLEAGPVTRAETNGYAYRIRTPTLATAVDDAGDPLAQVDAMRLVHDRLDGAPPGIRGVIERSRDGGETWLLWRTFRRVQDGDGKVRTLRVEGDMAS